MSSIRTLTFLQYGKPADLNYTEIYLLLQILERYNIEKHCSHFRRKWMAEARMDCKEEYIKILVRNLEKKGYLRVYERNHAYNRYVVPLLPGETLPPGEVIPDGPTLIDQETGKIWKLRGEGPRHDDEEVYANPPPVEQPPTPEDAELEAQFDASLAATERDQQERDWYTLFVTLAGEHPFGKEAEWRKAINELLDHNQGAKRPVEMWEFKACYELAPQKWNKGVVTPLSVYKNLSSLLSQVRAAKDSERKRQATLAAQIAEAPPTPLTDEERAYAAQVQQAHAEGKAQRQISKEWRIKNNIWTRDHRPGCDCPSCITNKRQWERQEAAKKPMLTT